MSRSIARTVNSARVASCLIRPIRADVAASVTTGAYQSPAASARSFRREALSFKIALQRFEETGAEPEMLLALRLPCSSQKTDARTIPQRHAGMPQEFMQWLAGIPLRPQRHL